MPNPGGRDNDGDGDAGTEVGTDGDFCGSDTGMSLVVIGWVGLTGFCGGDLIDLGTPLLGPPLLIVPVVVLLSLVVGVSIPVA